MARTFRRPGSINKKCAVCDAPDFRACPCPWDRPFDEWYGFAKKKLLDRIKFAPQEQ